MAGLALCHQMWRDDLRCRRLGHLCVQELDVVRRAVGSMGGLSAGSLRPTPLTPFFLLGFPGPDLAGLALWRSDAGRPAYGQRFAVCFPRRTMPRLLEN